jgi:EEF1A lysine methyltransferase 1
LASEAVRAAGPGGKIALVSCPTLYGPVKQKCPNSGKQSKSVVLNPIFTLCHFSVTLFEYDERFAAYGSDFCFYDYKNPLKVPPELGGSFDVVVADPPFLSEECLTKTAVTIRFLSKQKVLLCTG